MRNRNLSSVVVRNLVSFKKLSFLVLVFGLFPFFASADVLGDQQRFSIDKTQDKFGREDIDSVLQVANSTVYFYVEKAWWSGLEGTERSKAEQDLIELAKEFEQKIYPILTSTFGSEQKPGIDKDPAITVLFHVMKENTGGYTNFGDEYVRLQVPRSNEREMVYVNAGAIGVARAKGFLAHEFVHLITFNQKNVLRKTEEEVWLNELRAEYAPTLLGYDVTYAASNLKQRVENFLAEPTDSLTEFGGKEGVFVPKDYGVINLFAQYLVDQYGVQILVDSLRSDTIGIASLNEALQKGKFLEDFSEIFTNWTIAVFLNDCSYGPRYCYHNPNLVNLRVVPQTNFLPSIGSSTLSLNNTIKDWAGNWIKVLGGKDVLTVEFQGDREAVFRVPYLLESQNRTFAVRALELNSQGRGTIVIPDFNKGTRSIILIPSSQTKTTNLDDVYSAHAFSFVLSTAQRTPEEVEQQLIQELTLKIDSLKKEIAKLQAQLEALRLSNTTSSCTQLTKDLFFGMRGDSEVSCLQELLKSKEPGLYPEGLVSGNFFTLTQAAVVRFQEKYRSEVLAPLGFTQGTGYVGSLTRKKLNELAGS